MVRTFGTSEIDEIKSNIQTSFENLAFAQTAEQFAHNAKQAGITIPRSIALAIAAESKILEKDAQLAVFIAGAELEIDPNAHSIGLPLDYTDTPIMLAIRNFIGAVVEQRLHQEDPGETPDTRKVDRQDKTESRKNLIDTLKALPDIGTNAAIEFARTINTFAMSELQAVLGQSPE